MKRCMADIPIVTHIQRESAGMNKLYSQSMCSVKQWKSYQAAEAMVSAEVEEVRAEADEVEPGWSQVCGVVLFLADIIHHSSYPPIPLFFQVIWRQAMQYHQMVKQGEDQAKQAREEAQKAQQQAMLEQQRNAQAAKAQADAEKNKEANAEKAAEELLKQEERENEAKKGMKGLKKGFLG